MGETYNAAVDFVDRRVGRGDDQRPAFIDPERTLSFRDLHATVCRVGPMLRALGIEPENRVALILHDTVDYPILFWGAIRAGIIPVLLNTLLTADQYHRLLAHCRAKAAFVSPALLPTVDAAARGVPTLKAIVVAGSDGGDRATLAGLMSSVREPGEPANTCTDDVAYWQYSSGTTGSPKGVMHIHSTLRATAQLVGQRFMGLRNSDVVFSAAKSFFAYGLNNSLTCPLSVGAVAILNPDKPTAAGVFEILRRHQPTIFYAVPTLYAIMLADRTAVVGDGMSRLRLCFSAGEPLPADIGKNWKQRFGVDIINGVGATEMAHLFLANTPSAVEYGTSGRPIEGFEVRLTDESGAAVGNGTIGELQVRGPTAALGYWNQVEKSRSMFLGHWFKTGDKYERRDDGVFIYQGRTDDLFKAGGIWVSPIEVESALISHPGILEAAVVSAEDADGLLKPRAFVVLKHAVANGERAAFVDELKSHVRDAVGPWKYPRWIEIVEQLPKTATGKIQRHLLRRPGAIS